MRWKDFAEVETPVEARQAREHEETNVKSDSRTGKSAIYKKRKYTSKYKINK